MPHRSFAGRPISLQSIPSLLTASATLGTSAFIGGAALHFIKHLLFILGRAVRIGSVPQRDQRRVIEILYIWHSDIPELYIINSIQFPSLTYRPFSEKNGPTFMLFDQ